MKRWYHPNHFLPREIQHDPIWQRLTESDKKVYRFVCEHSYLTSRSPTRRYCEWTYGQIGQHVGLSRIQVLRIMQKLMVARLIYRWYIGDSGSNTIDGRPKPPRYEIPASRGMIWWWRRIRNPRKKKSHNTKEVNHEKKDQRATRVQRREKEQKKANLGAHQGIDLDRHRYRHT